MGRKNHIPDGWRDIQSIGQPIPGTRFIAFKVPLKGKIAQGLTAAKKFTPQDLNAAVKALNVELGLIIDLTNTARYYYAKDLPKSVQYMKLVTAGRKVPDDATILQFKKWVRRFLWENAENEKLIGVHCTYGINRTGYLICRYLIDVEGWDPKTAIQAFGEARGHHMNDYMYLTDLKTQPMRSNLGMNQWDAGDVVPPPNDTDGHTDRTSNEEHPRPAKKLRINDDGHNDIPEQIQLREFDFINKGPGQRRKPYYDQHFQDDPEPLEETRQSHFSDHHFSNDYQKEMQLKDLHFATGSGQRLQPCHDHHFCDDFPGSAQPEDNKLDHGQRKGHFPDIPPHSDMLIDSQANRSHGQRQRPFHDPQSNNEYQSQMQLKKLGLHNKRPEQRIRTFQDHSPHDDIQAPVEDLEFFRRGREQQMITLIGDHHHNDLQGEMPIDFDSRDSETRCKPFHESQSYDDFSKQVQLKDFLNTKQSMRLFGDHSAHDGIQYEGYVERGCHYLSQEHFSETPLFHRDYGSDEEDHQRNCRSDCSEDYRRIRSSDEIIRGEKRRIPPHSSSPVHLPSSSHQEVSSIAVDCERESQLEDIREIGQGKRLPVLTFDYNYGLPLNYIVEEEDVAHYQSHPRECCVWK